MTVESLAMRTVKLFAEQVKHVISCQIAIDCQVAVLQFIVGNVLELITTFNPSGLDDGQEKKTN